MTRAARAFLAAVAVVSLGAGTYLFLVRKPVPAPVDTTGLADPLPFDPDVRHATLPNGLRYYVRANRHPANRAELKLVVNAGSVLEDDDQRGLAHFVEHMAFNGTRRFPKQAIAAFMDSIGMRFGPSVNATTGYDETIYSLQVPTDRPDVIDRALMVLEDWAASVSFNPIEVDEERRVVIEEWRSRRGAGARMQDAQFPVLLAGSRYADRLPIGTTASIEGFTLEALQRFYRDWYRPDLMAVVAVGDFDPQAIERRITSGFGGIPAPTSPRPRPDHDVPRLQGTTFALASDPEAAGSIVSLQSRRVPRQAVTVGDYRREMVERLTTSLVTSRLSEIAQHPGGPLLSAGAARGRFVRGLETLSVSAAVREGGIEQGLAVLHAEAARMMRFGFTDEELGRQKTNVARGFERAMAEKDRRPSAALAAEYTRHFTVAEPVPGLEVENALTARFLPGVTLDDVNAVAREWLPVENRVVVVSAPARPGAAMPDAARLTAVLNAAAAAPLTPYVSRASATTLLDRLPEPGSVTTVTRRDEAGLVEWRLSNGALVVLKPTTFKDDEVVFAAASPGGTSLASDADFVSAQTAAQVVSSMGFGRFASGDLRRVLTGKIATVRPVIGMLEEGLSGGGSRQDLETLFQLIYLTFTQPRRDERIFAALTAQMKEALANQAATPDFAFGEALALAMSQDHPRARPLRSETVAQMDLDASVKFYRERFADASDFTFVFVGSFDLDGIRPFVERYLASLPSLGRKETWRDPGIEPARGVVERRVTKGLEPKGRVALAFVSPFAYGPEHGVALRAMGEVLQTRLRDVLREALGGTYVVTVNATASRAPREQARVVVDFGSDPARADALVTRVFEEIAALQQAGPTAQQLADVKATLLRDVESASRQNAAVAARLAGQYLLGDPPEPPGRAAALISALTAAAVRDAARTALDAQNHVKVILSPERR